MSIFAFDLLRINRKNSLLKMDLDLFGITMAPGYYYHVDSRLKQDDLPVTLTCNGPPESPWHESCPPVSWPAHKNISGMNSWRPARKNIILHRSLLTIGTCTSCSTDGNVPPSDKRPQPVTAWWREEKFCQFWRWSEFERKIEKNYEKI